VTRKVRLLAIVFAALLLSLYAAVYLIAGSEGFRRRVESELSARTGYTIKIETLRPTPWLGFVVSGVVVSRDGVVLFEGQRVSASLRPHELYFRRIRRLALERPVLHVSLQELFRPSAKPSTGFSIGALAIENGELVLDAGGSALRLNGISADATNLSLGGETGLRLSAEVPALEGSAVVSISGGAAERHAEITIHQGETSTASLAERKKVFSGALQLTSKAGDAYEAAATGEMRALRCGAATMSGNLSARFDIGPRFETVMLTLRADTPEFPAELLPATLPVAPGPARASLEGDYSAARKTMTVKKIAISSALGMIAGGGSISFAENPARLSTMLTLSDAPLDGLKPLLPGALAALRYNGKLAAKVSVSGPYNAPALTGTAWTDDGAVRGERLSLARFAFKIPFRWDGSLEARKGEFQATDLNFGGKGETNFKIARARLAAEIVKQPQQPLAVSADFDIAGGGFSTPDQSKIGEHWNAKGHLTCRDCAGEAAFQVDAQTESLELLWNKFFGDFKARKPAVRIDGRYRKTAGTLDLSRMTVALEAIGRVDVTGTIDKLSADPTFALDIKSDDFRPGGFYEFFIRDAFKAAYPGLEEVALGGKSDLALRARGTRERFSIEGKLQLQQGVVQERSGSWHAGPVNLDLPLMLSYPAAEQAIVATTAPIGRLSVGEIKSATVAIPQISTPVIFWNNALSFPEPIRLSLFGGRGLMSGLAWKDIVAAPADLSFSLELDDLKLDQITNALGWHRFGGTLSGSIPRVRWVEQALRGDGTITLGVFGGRAEIRGLEIDKPFSALRAIRLNTRLDALDLEQASSTFEFGHISGAVSGTIDGLVLTHGQPEEFRADIYTVDKPGVSRWISVEALNKITVVSSGNDAGSLYGGLASLFDFYRYSKLGFKATLKNDTLTLRGIESKDGSEYLVVGTLLPPTVNIVSHTQEISFNDLLARLERVKNSGKK
jgi:hypothetical protein